MSFLARSFARKAFPAVARPLIARRGFAEAVPADKLRLSLALPYTVCIIGDGNIYEIESLNCFF